MFIDARTLPDGHRITSDICVVGAGAAGITLALELADTRHQVALLESGGLELDDETQQLYAGEVAGFPYYDLDAIRLRYFGGTTNHWTGASRPLEPVDFESRPWVPSSGWPFGREELEPYYARAHPVCGLGPYSYDVSLLENRENPRLPLQRDEFETAIFQVSSPPTRFGEAYRSEIRRSRNVQAYLFANVVEIIAPSGGGQVEELRVTCLGGKKLVARARVYVLATGAVENARLLLASNRDRPAGVGNESDLVGRYFMEHVHIPAGVFLPSDPDLRLGLYRDRTVRGLSGRGILIPTAALLRREEILNGRLFISPYREHNHWRHTSEGVGSLVEIVRSLGRREAPPGLGADLATVVADLDELALYGYRWFFRPRVAPTYALTAHLENAPDPESRVTLYRQRDALGMPRARLRWRFGEHEHRTLDRLIQLLAQELGYSGLGRVRPLVDEPDSPWPSGVRGAWHQMGTTRMHEDPKHGVVDPNGRIHGLGNLFVAGSSVFPTSGYTNPTLTLVALSLRLADHLKGTLA